LVSEFVYLFVFDKYGKIIKELYLEGIEWFESGVFIQNKFFIHGTDSTQESNDSKPKASKKKEEYNHPQWIKIIEFE
jgi:hypothetical protein